MSFIIPVKVWDLDYVTAAVHATDRHELAIDWVGVSATSHPPLAVALTRNCVCVWDIASGRITAKVANNVLGAIVTLAAVTADGRFLLTEESGSLLCWNVAAGTLVLREEVANIQQILLYAQDTR